MRVGTRYKRVKIRHYGVIYQTERAILFIIKPSNVWIPRAMVSNVTSRTFSIPWPFAIDKGLVGLPETALNRAIRLVAEA
jgi:hypothetical protein